MEGLSSECGPKIFSRGRNKTKLHLVSKQLFTDGVLLQRAQGEAEPPAAVLHLRLLSRESPGQVLVCF